MAEIAESFKAVWHERTRLYQDVQRLQEQLADLQNKTERARADHDDLLSKLEHSQANVRELTAAMEQLEPAQDAHGEGAQLSAAERGQLGQLLEKLQEERDRLVEELRRVDAATAEERSSRDKLVRFLMEALKQVELASQTGSKAVAPHGEQNGGQGGASGEGRPPSDPASRDANTA